MIAAAASTGSPAQSVLGLVLWLVLWAVLIAAYWAPAVVARARRVPNLAQVILVNFFAFTVVCWVIALYLALKPAESRAA
jgi:hypothetical protein